jgi:WD40 repeat protein
MYGAAFSSDGRWLACASPNQTHPTLNLFDTEDWQLSDQKEVSDAHFISVSFSRDNKHLVTGDDEGAVRLREINPLRQVALIGRHTSRIKSVAFSPDGREVASAGDDDTIRLWDVSKRRFITTIGTHTAPALSVAFCLRRA